MVGRSLPVQARASDEEAVIEHAVLAVALALAALVLVLTLASQVPL